MGNMKNLRPSSIKFKLSLD
ncbi:rCG52897 [Rattus norvegicus]|uniref:RCG52897 n=1 Tax=Rattus norvegicus TaxID=10116 RepID=A6IRD3_RAT|nr:rCG52897 [Rattus norvegicus]